MLEQHVTDVDSIVVPEMPTLAAQDTLQISEDELDSLVEIEQSAQIEHPLGDAERYQSANYMFTWNNPPKGEDGQVISPSEFLLGSKAPKVKFLAAQLEKGERGTLHWQGYVSFTRKQTIVGLKAKVHQKWWWGSRRGSHDQALAYVTKEDTRYVCGDNEGAGLVLYGDPPSPGKRNDLIEAKEAIDGGDTLQMLWEGHFHTMVRYSRALQEYINTTRKNPRHVAGTDSKVKVTVLWGPPGTGKSTEALKLGGPEAFWLAPGNGNGSVWWDGYDNQETVVIDEFYGWIPKNTLQRMLQMMPFQVQTKGASRQLAAKNFIITSNSHPREWYKNTTFVDALLRRLTDIRHLTEVKDPILLDLHGHQKKVYPLWVPESIEHEALAGPLGNFITEPVVCSDCNLQFEWLTNGRCTQCWDGMLAGPVTRKRKIALMAEDDQDQGRVHEGCKRLHTLNL